MPQAFNSSRTVKKNQPCQPTDKRKRDGNLLRISTDFSPVFDHADRARRDSEINAMTDLASSVFRSRWHSIAYWVTTALVAFELALGCVWDILRVSQIRGLIVERLDYPLYFLTILGIWKLLDSVALNIPLFPRLKEWAYAGVIFDLTGAVASLWASGLIGASTMAYPIVMTGVTVASWALRPPSRRLGPG
jgi:hypothetical protein